MRRVIATASALAIAAFLSGCSDMLTGGQVDLPTYGPVTPPPPSPAGSAELPASFPRDIPVPRGLYRVQPGPLPASLSLAVTDLDATALDQARRMLLDAGYQVEPVLGQDMFLGTRYIVTVTDVSSSERGRQLDYTVFDRNSISGMPSIPQLTIPTLLPTPAAAAIPSTRRPR